MPNIVNLPSWTRLLCTASEHNGTFQVLPYPKSPFRMDSGDVWNIFSIIRGGHHRHHIIQLGMEMVGDGYGWWIMLTRSRFLSPAEQCYTYGRGPRTMKVLHPRMQPPRSSLITSKKLLVKLMGDWTLDEISHSCLFRLKQCTLPCVSKIP